MRRGEVYYAAVPYLPEAPLTFFVEDLNDEQQGLGTGRLMQQTPEENFRRDGKNPEFKVVLPFKRRMVLLVSSEEALNDPDTQSVLVMPIHTIYEEQAKTHPFYQKLISANCFPEAFYLGERSGRKSSISITQVKHISKNLIFDKVHWSLTPEEMTSVDVRFADCMGSSIILACQVCDRACQTCEILKTANQLRRV
ncbi:MAG: hypothetical protein ACM3ZC_15980 [Bacteroidota bacterium]